MKVKEKSVKVGLKLHIQKTKIMVSSPITSRQIDSEKMETVTDYIFLDSKTLWVVTAPMKIRHFLLGRKAITNLDTILKRYHFAKKGPYSQTGPYNFFSSHVQM